MGFVAVSQPKGPNWLDPSPCAPSPQPLSEQVRQRRTRSRGGARKPPEKPKPRPVRATFVFLPRVTHCRSLVPAQSFRGEQGGGQLAGEPWRKLCGRRDILVEGA